MNDLGLDLTQIWAFDRVNGKLSNPKNVPSSPGAGPRHFAFHPNGRFFYSLNEEASTLAFMTYDAGTGTLRPVQGMSTLPGAFVGTNFTSEVLVSRNGTLLYAANRLHDTIAVFSVDASGRATRLGEPGRAVITLAISTSNPAERSCTCATTAATASRRFDWSRVARK